MRSDRALRRRSFLMRATLATLVVAGHAWLGGATPGHAQQSDVDPRRSLVVTEQPILERFPLQRVLDQLVAQSGVRGLTSLTLFQQWWDTQNPGPGLGLGPHCDDEKNATTGEATLNTFPYECREHPAEGGEAASDPFTNTAGNPGAYIPIGSSIGSTSRPPTAATAASTASSTRGSPASPQAPTGTSSSSRRSCPTRCRAWASEDAPGSPCSGPT